MIDVIKVVVQPNVVKTIRVKLVETVGARGATGEKGDKGDPADPSLTISDIIAAGFITLGDLPPYPIVPTFLSEFNNDAGFITIAEIPTALADFSEDTTHRLVSDTQVTNWDAKENPLAFTNGVTRVVNNITNDLTTGKSGGQSIIGGTASGEGLTLFSTLDATKGKINFGASYYDEATNRLLISDTIIAAPSFAFEVSGVSPDIANTRYSNDASGGSIRNRKARGTVSVPAIVADGDALGSFSFSAYDGATFRQPASIRAVINGAPASNNVPADLVFNTGTSTGQEAVRISAGRLMGIGTGAIINAKFHVIATTEQIRLGYDASNYLSATVNSTGSIVFNLTGTTPKFTFSKDLVVSTLGGSGSRMMVVDNTGNVSAQTIPVAGASPVSASVSGSDFTTTSNISSNVTGLSVAIGTNKKYRVTVVLYTGCSTANGLKLAISGPAGAAILSGSWSGTSTGAATSQQIRSAAINVLTSTAFNRIILATGIAEYVGYVTTATTAGNVTVQVASTTNGDTSTIFIGSTIDIEEIT